MDRILKKINSMPTTVTRLLLLALLLLAFALRVYALDRYPTGVSPDEAGDVIDILNIAHSGRFPIYEDYAIPEPLHRILYALLSLLVGNSVGSIRFLGACFGVLTVALVGWVARRLSLGCARS
jgi:predicted membrane-bound mannosyltransferase